MGLSSLSDASIDLLSATNGRIDEMLSGKPPGLTAENDDGRVPLDLADGREGGGDIYHAKNGGDTLSEHAISGGRGQEAQAQGEAFLLSPAELLSATLEEFSAAVGEFSDASKAWLEEASCVFVFFARFFFRKS